MRKNKSFEKKGEKAMEQEVKKKYNTDMSPEDIRKTYLEAANKREQIKILSEINLCSRETIREILIEQGIPEDEIPKTRAPREKPEDKLKAAEEKKIEKKPDEAKEKTEKKQDAAVQGIRPPRAVLDLISEEVERLMKEILEKEEKLAVLHAFLISVKGEGDDVESL